MPVAYCTILASNYLPKALTLAESLARHHPDSRLHVLLIDAPVTEDIRDLPRLDNVEYVGTDRLGLPDREVRRLATIYDLVELATAIKPLLLGQLLLDSEQAAYLDPDTFVTAPMHELSPALAASEGGILLTPHFLRPLPDEAPETDGHLLTVGVYNLGFAAVDRRARPFLDWWWGHLREECLFDYLSGLFVDQKWVDVGAVLFAAATFRHPGYNVSIVNLHERPVGSGPEGWTAGEQPLRLYHFHAFDAHDPSQLSTRGTTSTARLREENEALDLLCKEYAALVLAAEAQLPPASSYPYATDTRGRHLSRQLRRAWRLQDRAGASPPSPFDPAQAGAWDAWRKRAWRQVGRNLAVDAAKSMRIALPEEYGRLRARFPGLTRRMRERYVGDDGIWG